METKINQLLGISYTAIHVVAQLRHLGLGHSVLSDPKL